MSDSVQKSNDLSENDLELVTALQLAPRATWSQLSHILGVHATTLSRRWERLETAGLARISIAPGRELFRLGDLAFVELTCRGNMVQSVVDRLVRDQRLMTVQFIAGQAHLLLTVFTSGHSLSEFLLDTVGPMEGVLHYAVRSMTHQFVGASGWHFRALPTSKLRQISRLNRATASEGTTVPMDAVSRALMTALSADGRMGFRDLGLAAGVSPLMAARRVKRLVGDGYIDVRCDVARIRTANSCTAVVWGSLPPDQLAAIDSSLMDSVPALRLLGAVTGANNVHMVLWLNSPADLMRVEHQLLAAIAGLRIDDRRIVLRTFKYNGARLRSDGAFDEIIPLAY